MTEQDVERLTGKDPLICQKCSKGRMKLVGTTYRKKQLILIQEGIP